MLVVPVIDLQAGRAVHGRGGRRTEYAPILSVLADRPDPIALARGVIRSLGLREIYLADLDAIAGNPPAWSLVQTLVTEGVHLWLDAGVGRCEQVEAATERLTDHVDLVLGLETLTDLQAVDRALSAFGPQRTIVSLDLDAGRPRTPIRRWQDVEVLEIARELLTLGVRRLIVLDIRRVGGGTGTGTEALIQQLRHEDAGLQICCGGGLANLAQISTLARQGADAVLLATTLHEGRIGRAEVDQIRRY